MKTFGFIRLVPIYVALSLALTVMGASAGVVITGTRIIYPVDARDVSVRLTNTGNEPSLVQTWIDEGDVDVPLEKLDVPFEITPAMFRLDPNKTQLLRLIYNGPRGEPLEKEKVYWFNALEIPPKPAADLSKNYLQFAVKTRIKLFLRPGKEHKCNDPAALMEMLKWSIDRSGGKNVKLTVENPSIFHASLIAILPSDANKSVLTKDAPKSGMVPPGGSLTFTFRVDNPSHVANVMYHVVDDFGAYREGLGVFGN